MPCSVEARDGSRDSLAGSVGEHQQALIVGDDVESLLRSLSPRDGAGSDAGMGSAGIFTVIRFCWMAAAMLSSSR